MTFSIGEKIGVGKKFPLLPCWAMLGPLLAMPSGQGLNMTVLAILKVNGANWLLVLEIKLELRTNVSSIDKISLLVRQHYIQPYPRWWSTSLDMFGWSLAMFLAFLRASFSQRRRSVPHRPPTPGVPTGVWAPDLPRCGPRCGVPAMELRGTIPWRISGRKRSWRSIAAGPWPKRGCLAFEGDGFVGFVHFPNNYDREYRESFLGSIYVE